MTDLARDVVTASPAAAPRPDRPDRRARLAQGIAWGATYQVFETALSFASMLILVRLIAPAEYGRAGAVVGILALLNTFGAGVFMAHALQLPDRETPDWGLHWSAGFYVQLLLSGMCHLAAAICWLAPGYQPIAPLLHLAALGLVLDWPNQLSATMLRRDLDFRRLKAVLAACTLLKLSVTVALALAGTGAYAIVIGSNVIAGLPLGLDLLLVRGWRPPHGWWRRLDWRRYRATARFGVQRAGSGVLASLRGALEAAVLPASLGFGAMGLLNRAQALYGITFGKVNGLLEETAYPFLPRESADPQRYGRQATLFLQAVLLVAVPGALFIGLEGPVLSRFLYGQKWVAMDPLIWPAALAGLALSLFGSSQIVLLASGRVRVVLGLDAAAATLTLPVVAAAWLTRDPRAYAWVLAAGQILAAAAAVTTASGLLRHVAISRAIGPPLVSALVAMSAVVMTRFPFAAGLPAFARLALAGSVYALTFLLVLRIVFARAVTGLLERVPGGAQVRRWMRLDPALPVADARPTL